MLVQVWTWSKSSSTTTARVTLQRLPLVRLKRAECLLRPPRKDVSAPRCGWQLRGSRVPARAWRRSRQDVFGREWSGAAHRWNIAGTFPRPEWRSWRWSVTQTGSLRGRFANEFAASLHRGEARSCHGGAVLRFIASDNSAPCTETPGRNKSKDCVSMATPHSCSMRTGRCPTGERVSRNAVKSVKKRKKNYCLLLRKAVQARHLYLRLQGCPRVLLLATITSQSNLAVVPPVQCALSLSWHIESTQDLHVIASLLPRHRTLVTCDAGLLAASPLDELDFLPRPDNPRARFKCSTGDRWVLPCCSSKITQRPWVGNWPRILWQRCCLATDLILRFWK